jgi:O-antigen/teichoic acid export membrane protein
MSHHEHPTESTTTFFRQGSWLVIATGTTGVLMLASQMVANKLMNPDEWGTFFTLLRLYLLFSIPALGLQTVFAQQTAAAITPDQHSLLAATTRSVHRGLFAFWILLALIALTWQSAWLKLLNLHQPAALWITLAIGLASLWVPVWKGIVQGRQHFAGLGWSLILDGAGRFAAVTLILLLGGQAVGGMAGALFGQIASLAIAFWVTRDILQQPASGFTWTPWLKKVIPLTIGSGVFMLMTTIDVIYVRTTFQETESTLLYNPASMIGLALMVITTPLVQVMFPKVARSTALTQDSRAMLLALGAAAAVGAAAALACTLFPSLPLRIIFLNNPKYLDAAPLVPWFAWALLPLMLAMVLANNLLAQARFKMVPWLAAIAITYIIALISLQTHLTSQPPIPAFKLLLAILGTTNSLLLIITIAFSLSPHNPRSQTSKVGGQQ